MPGALFFFFFFPFPLSSILTVSFLRRVFIFDFNSHCLFFFSFSLSSTILYSFSATYFSTLHTVLYLNPSAYPHSHPSPIYHHITTHPSYPSHSHTLTHTHNANNLPQSYRLAPHWSHHAPALNPLLQPTKLLLLLTTLTTSLSLQFRLAPPLFRRRG